MPHLIKRSKGGEKKEGVKGVGVKGRGKEEKEEGG